MSHSTLCSQDPNYMNSEQSSWESSWMGFRVSKNVPKIVYKVLSVCSHVHLYGRKAHNWHSIKKGSITKNY